MKRSYKTAAAATIGALAAITLVFISHSPSADLKSLNQKSGVVVVRSVDASLRPVKPNIPTSQPTESAVIDREAAYQASLANVSSQITRLTTAVPPVKLLHDKLRSEARDETWATKSEAILQKEFDNLARYYGSRQSFAINCGTTLCEVYGISGPDKELNSKSNEYIQSIAFLELLEKNGFHDAGTAFGKNSIGRKVVLSYYRR